MAKLTHVAPNARNGVAPLPTTNEPETDLVRKFMRENPVGTLPPDEDAPLGQPVVEAGTIPPTDPPTDAPADAPAPTDAPATPPSEPTAPTAPPVEAAKSPAADAPAVTPPAAPATAPVAPAATVEPKPSYDPGEKIYLHESVEPWTREQVLMALQERAALTPKAAETEQFRTLFGNDYKTVESQWKPIIDSLRSDPDRLSAVDSVLQADPGLLQYLNEAVAYYQALPQDQRYQQQPSQPARTQPANDPRIAQYERTLRAMQKQMLDTRARNEWDSIYQRYPFLRTDEKARRALLARAGEMFASDESHGKDPLECRGLVDAMNENAVFLEAAGIAYAARTQAQPAPAPDPNASAMLSSSATTAATSSRPSAPSGFRGNPDDAVAAFLKDYPSQ